MWTIVLLRVGYCGCYETKWKCVESSHTDAVIVIAKWSFDCAEVVY